MLSRARAFRKLSAAAALTPLAAQRFSTVKPTSAKASSSSKAPVWYNRFPPRQVMSGIQPTGIVHLGNYLGALVNWAFMQEEEQWQYQSDALRRMRDARATALVSDAALSPEALEAKVLASVRDVDPALRAPKILCQLADLHALTTHYPRDDLVASKRTLAATLMALGMRQDSSTIFAQSTVPENSELMWVLLCSSPLSWLFRMTQFKDKAQKATMALSEDASAAAAAAAGALERGARGSTVAAALASVGADDSADLIATGVKAGLLMYPTLMAADILIFRATHVPCGADQDQHLEFCRDLASTFNANFCPKKFPFFPEPRGMAPRTQTAARIMSLRNVTKKMSKSELAEASRLCVTDSDATLIKHVRTAVTDAEGGLSYEPDARPGVANLLDMYTALDNVRAQRAHVNGAAAAVATAAAPARAAAAAVPGGSLKAYFASMIARGDANDIAGIEAYEALLASGLTGPRVRTPADSILALGADSQMSALKKALGESVVAELGPIRDEVARLLKDGHAVDERLSQGAEDARSRARDTLAHVHDIMGLGIRSA